MIFRRDSLTSHLGMQYAAFYGPRGRVVLARRRLGEAAWETERTLHQGGTRDAHNCLSLMADGEGYLHLAWDAHDSPLRYCRGKEPGSLRLGPATAMTGLREKRVTYPEFLRLADGDLLFFYRHGASGNGDLMLNRYHPASRTWSRVQEGLIDGQGRRSAYHQAALDERGVLHLSWVWRETPDVASNHDLCYAQSPDGGRTWLRSDGSRYQLPITAASAEYIRRIPQGRGLINQTSMAVDQRGDPCVATYWTPEGSEVPQYFLVHRRGGRWQTSQVSRRSTPFSLSGLGTKSIPISRPLLLLDRGQAGQTRCHMVFRDVERGHRVSLATCDNLDDPQWRFVDLTREGVGAWEPTHDSVLWLQKGLLHLMVQKVGQGDGEKLERLGPQPVWVLEWQPPA
ncbi:BNR repeat-containing protein [Desulfoferula mesophila]|uniref:BNR repeat-containing protein n=1 Tax=Desulfoferula mesophila TaxID=3058419 RepID=UPI0030CCFC2F